MMNCFECRKKATERHHVVPKSLGGTKTVSLCPDCHGKVHGVNRLNISVLTKAALDKKREVGIIGGRRANISQDTKDYIVKLRKENMTFRKIARTLNEKEFKTAQGGVWHASTIKVILDRIN